MATYRGLPVRTTQGGFKVFKDDGPLDPARSLKAVNHSPDGFNWGYGGSGPAQLALALLLEETDEATALTLYQKFKWDLIAHFPSDHFWVLKSEAIQHWIQKQEVRA